MKPIDRVQHLQVSTVILGLALLWSPALSSAAGNGQELVELGNAEFNAVTTLPAAAGGNVSIDVRVTLRTSREVIGKLNEGISSGQFQSPYWGNKEFINLILNSKPGSFEVEFLGLNKESRFYFFFEEELKKIKVHPSIPYELKGQLNEYIRKAKSYLYQTIRVNDFAGSKITFAQDADSGRIEFVGSNKRGNPLVGKLVFKGKEMPIFDAMKKVLSEDHKPKNPSIAVKEQGSFEDIIISAQKKHVLKSRD